MRKFESFLLALILAFSMSFSAFASDSSSISYPDPDSLHSLEIFNKMLSISSSPDDLINNLSELSPNDLLQYLAEMCYNLERSGDSPEILSYITEPIVDTLIPVLTEEDYAEMVSNEKYSNYFRIFLIDLHDYFFDDNSNIFNFELNEIVKNKNFNEDLRSYAAFHIDSNNPEYVESIVNFYNSDITTNNKILALGTLNRISPLTAEQISSKNLSNYSNENKKIVVYSDKILIRGLDSYESQKAKDILELNKDILQNSTDKEFTKGILFAMSDFKSQEAVKTVFDTVDFESQSEEGGFLFYTSQNFEEVEKYLKTASFSDIKKCIEVAPQEEFRPLLENLKSQRNNDINSNEINYLLDLIDNADNIPTTRLIASGYQGYIAYRDGVDFPGTTWEINWHAGLVNRPVLTNSDSFIHIGGTGKFVSPCSYSTFVSSDSTGATNNFMGVYGTNTGTRTRGNITELGQDLLIEAINYTFYPMLTHNASSSAETIKPENILKIRCDGVTEYCYEFWGVRLQGSDGRWDISTPNGAKYHNQVTYSPKNQSTFLTRKD